MKMDIYVLFPILWFAYASAIALDPLYTTTNTVLSIANNPYQVISHVVVSPGATLTIPNGIEIIFTDYFTIEVQGSINMGCYDTNTSNNHTRGLYLPQHVYIHSNSSDRMGGVSFPFRTNGEGQFCNVLFETLHNALDLSGSNTINIDNCEFSDVYRATYDSRTVYHSFTDCYFHDSTQIAGGNCLIFDNCLFERLTDGLMTTRRENINIYNSDIIGDHTQTCVDLQNGDNTIENTTLINCASALRSTSGSHVTVRYNTFENNTIALYYATIGGTTIQYNNFINNTINVQTYGDIDNGDYNYWGIPSSNQSQIGATIDDTDNPTKDPTFEPTMDPTTDPTHDPTLDPTTDVCDGYSTALFQFWPWLDAPYEHDKRIEGAWTFNFTNCDSLNSETSYYLWSPTSPPTNVPSNAPSIPTTDPTDNPTKDPTFEPTMDPTTDPTHDPTLDPTTDPTDNPTKDPTFEPTVEPTTDPTHDPTIDPTTDPTDNPTKDPTFEPTVEPTTDPTHDPTIDPTTDPTDNP
eukprot:5961_1